MDRAIKILEDKEFAAKQGPYATSYIVQMLDSTFKLKTYLYDSRFDDNFILGDQENEPMPSRQDNISSNLQLNRDELIKKLLQPKLETSLLSDVKTDLDARSTVSKTYKLSSMTLT